MARAAFGADREITMRPSPFLNDPRDEMRRHVAKAVASPIEAVRAIHIRAAEHQAALARASGLDAARPARAARHDAAGRGPIAWLWRGWRRLGTIARHMTGRR